MKNSLTPTILKSLAGEILYSRGEDYFAGGCVSSIMEEEEAICAKVQGTQLYRTKLHLGRDELDYECNCLLGRDGTFCKHLVATGLAWIRQKKGPRQEQAPTSSRVTDEDIRKYLSTKDKSTLVEMVLEHAAQNSYLRARLAIEVVMHQHQESHPAIPSAESIPDRSDPQV